jgi:stage III sporulation protein AE
MKVIEAQLNAMHALGNQHDKACNKPHKCGNYRNVRNTLVVVLVLFMGSLLMFGAAKERAQVDKNYQADQKTEDELGQNVDDMLSALNLWRLEELLRALTDRQREIFGGDSFIERVRATIAGDIGVGFGGFVQFIFYLLGVSILAYAPMLAAIVAIALAYNLLSSIKGKFASQSTDKIIYFACLGAITVILLAATGVLIAQTIGTLDIIRNLASAVLPILLTVMTGIGATASAAVYQPSVAIFSMTMIELVSLVAVPVFIMSFVFNIVGNLSEGIKLSQLSDFCNMCAKWMMGTLFFLFLAFLSLQGITASVFDGISVRTAKFAIARYIPIIGGYLSEGFNLVMAGGVLIKNAVGLSAIMLLLSSVLPLIVNLVAFSLMLKLGAAVTEPMGESKIPKILSGVSKQASILAVSIIALTFLFFVFLLLIISTGNLML